MLDLRRIDDRVSVAPQIDINDLPAIKAAGFTTIINNRPDDEEAGQPRSADLRAAAEAAGLVWHDIPFGAGGLTPHEMNTTRAVLRAAAGPVLAFCRSGTRSCNLWAIARAAEGDPVGQIVAKGARAGYDLQPLQPTLMQLSANP